MLGTMVSTINFSNVIFDVFSLENFREWSRYLSCPHFRLIYQMKGKKKRNTEEKKDNGKAKWKISQFQLQFEEF